MTIKIMNILNMLLKIQGIIIFLQKDHLIYILNLEQKIKLK